MSKIKNFMIKPILYSALALGTIGCSSREEKTELSDVLHEDALVVETVYTHSRHDSGSSVGMDLDLNISFHTTSINIPEKYAVVFKCQHGKFIVEGTDAEHKRLWEKLVEGQKVDVTYREIYKTIYNDKDGDGKKDLVERILVNYDFLGAEPKEKQ